MNSHKILGVSQDATLKEIKAAYLVRAQRYHPDAGGDTWAFQKLQEAYEDLLEQHGSRGRQEETAQREAERREAERREAERREAERRETAQRETAQRDAERRGTTRRETEQCEAARRKTERREAARRMAAYCKAERRKATQREFPDGERVHDGGCAVALLGIVSAVIYLELLL